MIFLNLLNEIGLSDEGPAHSERGSNVLEGFKCLDGFKFFRGDLTGL